MGWSNTLYCADNLAILRGKEIPDESVDLIYLDPPFNSNASYNVLFREVTGDDSMAQVAAFEDSWEWGSEPERQYIELVESGGSLATFLPAQREFLGTNNMMAYLVMMAPRLVELHRVLKPTGSIYLHCDPTASHYLKLLMDAVFGPESFLSEVIWKRTGTHSSALRWAPIHDVLLCYAKVRGKQTWNRLYVPLSDQHRRRHYRRADTQGRLFAHGELTAPGVRHGRSGAVWRGFDVSALGRHWTTTVEKLDELDLQGKIHFPSGGGWPRLIRFEDESKGRAVGDVWDDIAPLNMKARERLGYPTQKPEALLARILEASSNEGDLVLDPFCGCGTTINVAERMRRRWIGIDITHLAMGIINHRLRETFGSDLGEYRVKNLPEDLASARALALQDRYEFQWWVFDRLHVPPPSGNVKKKGADAGIDGTIHFVDAGNAKKIRVQVKSGQVQVRDVRDLRGVIERDKAEIGVLVTLEPPTKPMLTEAAAAGLYRSPGNKGASYDRIQILTVEELLAGDTIQYPRPEGAVQPRKVSRAAKSQRPRPPQPNQLELELPLPLENNKAPQRRTPFQEVVRRRVVVASAIVNQLHQEKHFGRTKLAKLVYLADMHCKLGLQMDYARQAAGPLDPRALYNEKIGIEAVAKHAEVFSTEEGPDIVRYRPGKKLERIAARAREILGAASEGLDALIGLLAEMSTDQVEIVATLYACWNDLLLAGEVADDETILKEFRLHWHDRKKRFRPERLVSALAWMRQKNLIPAGSGKRTSSRPPRD